MKELSQQQRRAMEAVAKKFAVTWETGDKFHDAFLRMAGKRVAVEIRSFTLRGAGKGKIARPRLRFDKVATRLIEQLRATCGGMVPEGVTVLMAVTAPIRLPAKTAEALEEKIRTMVERGVKSRAETVHGNRVQMRLVGGGSKRASKMIGFVHNPETDAAVLFDMATGWIVGDHPGDRWLVGISDVDGGWTDAFRTIFSQFSEGGKSQKVVMVFGDGKVESLP